MKILIISDAWQPQVNGVVRTLQATVRELTRAGHQALVVGPKDAGGLNVPLPFYPEIRLAFFAQRRLARIMRDFVPDFIHIATEGPLGWAVRRLCVKDRRPFTTAYHTRFPEYLAARAPRILSGTITRTAYAMLRRFHAPAAAVMVATPSVERDLRARRFDRLVRWSRGVDTDLFRPYGKDLATYAALARPILLYVGRVAVEKNLRAFLDLPMAGSKIVIGDGPDLAILRRDYPAAHFPGTKSGDDLARHYAAADLFVFPSLTDTFGLVLLEACAAGLRIAACPASGASDIFADAKTRSFAVLDMDLRAAVEGALKLPDRPDIPRAFALGFSWTACTQQFIGHLR